MLPNHDQLESIFLDAIELTSAAEQLEFIRQVCGDDAELREQVLAMLDNHARAEGFMAVPESIESMECEHEANERAIGPYRLLEKVGEGGFGLVYRAEQQSPLQRIVALKLLKPGMDSSQVVARFEYERQALALLDHPHIARVLDAGTTHQGRPYFVMEFVDGLPINQYCDQHRLTIRERLDLFVTICQTVHYSHYKGIIHRDLKPTNVLVANVDGRHVLKVIDFGIAKAISHELAEQRLLTQTGGFIGTLETMSPEQAQPSAVDIDTRADIYGLGILLFELLTGTTPLTRQQIAALPLDEVLRTIREVESPLASVRLAQLSASIDQIAANRRTDAARLCKVVEGELDWIVAKCLEKDRARRYDSANSLACDVERYLNNQAVEAGPPSAWYKLRKFSRRHWRSMLVAASLLLMLITTAVTMTTAYFVVSREQHQKELALIAEQQRRRETRAALDALSSLAVKDLLARQATLKPEHKRFLQEAIESYERFALNTNSDDESRSGAANASVRIAQMLNLLGQTSEAEAAWKQALERYQTLSNQHRDDEEYRTQLARAYMALAGIYKNTGHPAESEAAYNKLLEVREQLLAREPTRPDYQLGLALAQTRLGILYKNTGRVDEALQLYEHARSALTKLVREMPGELEYQTELAQTLLNLAIVLEQKERLADAEAVQREGIDLLERIRSEQPEDDYCLDTLAILLNNLGNMLRDQDRFEEAEACLQRSLEHRRTLAQMYPAVPEYSRGLAMTLNNLGILHKNQNRMETALESYGEAVKIQRQLVVRHPAIVNYKNEAAGSMVNLARVYLTNDRFAEARQLLVEAEPYHRAAVQSNPKHPTYQHYFRLNRWRLAETCLGLGDHRSATKAIEQFTELATEMPRDAVTSASLWCQCIALVDNDSELAKSERAACAAQYGDKAMGMLKVALERDPEVMTIIQSDAALNALHSRDDFQSMFVARR